MSNFVIPGCLKEVSYSGGIVLIIVGGGGGNLTRRGDFLSEPFKKKI